jgi:hypothetical protein
MCTGSAEPDGELSMFRTSTTWSRNCNAAHRFFDASQPIEHDASVASFDVEQAIGRAVQKAKPSCAKGGYSNR